MVIDKNKKRYNLNSNTSNRNTGYLIFYLLILFKIMI